MSEILFLVKGQNNFGTYAYGVCKVISHKGALVTETDFDNSNGVYRFKVRGASKQTIDRNGIQRWQRQKLFCIVRKDSVFAETAKNLNYGDVLDIFGAMRTSEYTTDSGKKRKTSFCNLCKLQVIAKVGGEPKPEIIETELEDEIDDVDEFSEFDDL